MRSILKTFIVGAVAANLFVPQGFAITPPEPAVNKTLQAHQNKYSPARLERFSDRIYFTRGYGYANMIFVEGDDGIIVIDTSWRVETAAKALSDFRQQSKSTKPIKALIYTHTHPDHTSGTRAIVLEGKEAGVEVIAPQGWADYQHGNSAKTPNSSWRMLSQMGMMLPTGIDGNVASAVGAVITTKGTTSDMLPPTITVEDKLELTIAGVRMEFFHAPSDLEEQIAVWFPDEKVLATGDAVGSIIPAWATPRYEKNRDVNTWVNTYSLFLEYPAEYLLGGHGWPIYGRENIKRALRNTQDIGKFLNDQVIRLVNKNFTADQTVEHIMATIPKHLLEEPEIPEHYHRLSWMIRGLYAKTAGWFHGDSVQFIKPIGIEEAQKVISLGGGERKVYLSAQEAYENGDYGWAGQLATYLLRLNPDNHGYKKLKAYALKSAGYQSKSANERNYLLTDAMILEGTLDPTKFISKAFTPESLNQLSLKLIFEDLGVRVDPSKCQDKELAVVFSFEDTGEQQTLRIRKGVGLATEGSPAAAAATVTLTKKVLYKLLTGNESWRALLEEGALTVTGSKQQFSELMDAFEWGWG